MFSQEDGKIVISVSEENIVNKEAPFLSLDKC